MLCLKVLRTVLPGSPYTLVCIDISRSSECRALLKYEGWDEAQGRGYVADCLQQEGRKRLIQV